MLKNKQIQFEIIFKLSAQPILNDNMETNWNKATLITTQ